MGSLTDDKPPVPRYRFTLTVTGNTLDEIESELEFLGVAVRRHRGVEVLRRKSARRDGEQ